MMKGEKSNSGAERGDNGGWSELEELGRNGFTNGDIDGDVEKTHKEAKTAASEGEHYDENADKEGTEYGTYVGNRAAIEYDMAEARGVFDSRKKERFREQRIQEFVERDLNSKLSKVDDLEMEVIAGNPEIQKRSVNYEGVDIPIYDLGGIPFSFLTTTVDYRSGGTPGTIGTESYKKVLENPSIWDERRDVAEKSSEFGTRGADARGDTISASFWNSESNSTSYVPGRLVYGFENVQADSVIAVFNGDGGTSNLAEDQAMLLNLKSIEQIEGPGGTINYNEVLLKRYSENGMPRRPDYIIVERNRISEEALRHAKYFGIPIINVVRPIYERKAANKGKELLDSIDENDSYEELNRKVDGLLRIPEYKKAYRVPMSIGRNEDLPNMSIRRSALEEKCLEISRMELSKRLGFVKSKLEEAIRSIESATEKGLSIKPIVPGFEEFRIVVHDVQNELEHTKDGIYPGPSILGGCNWIEIEFKLKGSLRFIETNVFDGERICRADELPSGYFSKEDIENADSSFYDALEHVVLRYFEAIRKNNEIISNAA